MALAPGTRLGAFEIVSSLGSGGMGEVYRARDTRLGREVAVKVLPDATAKENDARARFEREARAIAALNHPNICTLHDVGEEGGHTYLVMELLAGETLHQLLSRGPMSIAAILDHGAALADALDTAHSRGIVHRDLKPANVFVTAHGAMKILDFGLAKATVGHEDATRALDAALTGPGAAIGTLSYMSPEQLKGDVVDARSDVFSLGLVLYEMATGQRAFGGKTGAQVSAAILHETPAPPSTLRRDLPAKLEDAILKALEKDRDLRYQSAAELRADLKRLKRQSDSANPAVAIESKPTSSSTSVAPVASTPAPPSSSDAALAAGLARRHPVAIALGALALITGIVGTWYAFNKPARAARVPELTLQALTIDGQAGHATIASDGKFIAYVRADGVTFSVVVKQIGSNSDVVILPPTDRYRYGAPSVTPDNSYVDVVRFEPRTRGRSLIRVPFLGGPPRLIAEGVAAGVGWSPDGRRMAFVKFQEQGLGTKLFVADADGRNERVLYERKGDTDFIGMMLFTGFPPARPAWSPDGRWVAVAGVNITPDRFDRAGEILEVNAESGDLRPIRYLDGVVTELAYRSDDELVASVKSRRDRVQWWFYPREGTAVQLTRDLSDVADVQLTADRTTGVATRTSRRTSIVTVPAAGGAVTEAVAESAAEPNGAKLDQAGTLFYVARVPDGLAAFRSEAAKTPGMLLASALQQLTPSPDGRFVIGISEGKVTRMNADGTNPTVLLTDPSANLVTILPDGSALAYVSNKSGHQRPWLLPLSGGEPRRLSDTYIAGSEFWLTHNADKVIFAGEKDTQLCAFPTFSDCRSVSVAPGPLSADGKTVYAVMLADLRNIAAQPLDGRAPVPLTHFTDGYIIDFSLSADRTKLVITRGSYQSDVVMIRGIR